jgi:hypothetical protein
MTDDEILLLAEQSVNKVCVIAVTNDDLIAFARAIESRTRASVIDEWDHPPHRNCDCKHCVEYWSDVYPNKGDVCGNN